MTIRGIGRLRASSRYDPAAMDWYSRVLTAGGTANATTIAAVSKFAASCRLAGIWTKLNRVNLFCGNQLTAALVPLKVGAGSATDTNTNFVSGDYTQATGITGNGTTKYVDTGLNPLASLTNNNTHLAVYNRASTEAAGGATMGCINTGTSMCALYNPLGSDGKLYSNLNDAFSGRVASASAISTPYGFAIGTRTSSSNHEIYRNGALVNSNATSGGAFPNATILVFCIRSAGTPSAFSSGTLAGYSIGTGLTASESAAYNTIMEAFQDALGRGVQ